MLDNCKSEGAYDDYHGKKFNVSEQIIQACRLSEISEKVYGLPPLEGRINFASQQMRALNLIWALHDGVSCELEVEGRSNIAVVGAGFAGITAVAALLGYGHKVTHFEADGQILSRQRGTKHRQVNPTVNFWPCKNGIEFSSTTVLPFFDWHEAKVDDVVRQIDGDWEELVSSHQGTYTPMFHKPVNDVVPRKLGDRRLKHLVTTDITGEFSESKYHFDIVILACGFKVERGHLVFGSTSYWTPDDLETKAASAEIDNVLISGCGDGGYIDALRTIFEFKDGSLAFQLIELLSGSCIEDAVRDADVLCKEYHNAIQQKLKKNFEAEADKVRDKYIVAASILYDFKCSADAGNLPEVNNEKYTLGHEKNISKAVHLLAFNDWRNKVYILDERSLNPFISGASPIHKLLLAYAYFYDKYEYQKGKINPEKLSRRTIKTPNKITLPDGSKLQTDKTHVVIRHGAPLNFESFMPKKVGDGDMRSRFTAAAHVLSPYIFEKRWGEIIYRGPDCLQGGAFGSNDYVSKRENKARRAINSFEDRLGRNLWVDAVDSSELDGKRNDGCGTDCVHIEAQYYYAGEPVQFGLPNHKLYGIPVTFLKDNEIRNWKA